MDSDFVHLFEDGTILKIPPEFINLYLGGTQVLGVKTQMREKSTRAH